MGALLDLFKNNETGLFIDLENPKPSENEKVVHSKFEEILSHSELILEKIKSYGDGCKELIRVSISENNPTNEHAVWERLIPNVETLKGFYEYSQQLTKSFPQLIEELCNTEQTIIEKQALAKQLGLTLDFALRFDDIKMKTIAIQNDFSHFRRTSNGAKIKGIDIQIDLKDDLANRMSLFYASPTPIMTCLVNSFTEFMKTSKLDFQHVTQTIATISNVCAEMVKGGKYEKSATNLFCLRTMTGCILMFDNIEKTGAFSKKSPINIRNCVGALKESKEDVEPLLNAIRYTSKNLSSAPENIKELLK
eukprot:TRINITY_DN54_c1_g1_i1.p1 TRINITY_DN54_c1_g1~~TRINITY_DN54_c1_g1_i1.p1  ORF type:complete len:307 (-),score=71.36 TRINITY_DN54_c1_g1_i1:125-1045(-)